MQDFNRWYMPGEIGQEKRDTDLPLEGEPAFEGRRIVGGKYGEYNGYGGLNVPGGQTWLSLVPIEKFSNHPEYYSYFDLAGHPELVYTTNDEQGIAAGRLRPTPDCGQLCTSNPDVIRIVAEAVRQWFKDNPEGVCSLSPADNGMFCECDYCIVQDPPPAYKTNRVFGFANQIAERLYPDFPDRRISVLAYRWHTPPPTDLKIHPMIVPVIARFGEYGYGGDSKLLEDTLAGWHKLAPELATYEFVGHWNWFGFMPFISRFADDLVLYKRYGVKWVCSETHQNWATQGFNLWAAQRLLWNRQWSLGYLVLDYCQGMYHDAADDVQDVLCSILLAKAQDVFYESHDAVPQLLSEGLLAECSELLRCAQEKIKGDSRAFKRLGILKKGLRFTEYWANGIRQHDPKKLRRAIHIAASNRQLFPYVQIKSNLESTIARWERGEQNAW